MTEMVAKAALLQRIQAEYKQFETLLTPLSEEQMTTPGVNSAWTVKDNVAHLTTWQDYLLDQHEHYQEHGDIIRGWLGRSH